MANDAGTPSSRKKKNRKRRRKRKKMTMTGGRSASLSLTATTRKKTAKTKGHHPWQQQQGDRDGDELNHPSVPIQPPSSPAAARNHGDDTWAASAQPQPQPRGEQDHPQERAADVSEQPSSTCCCICGAARWHNEYYCAWNYMDGRGSHASSCRHDGCGGPGQHAHAARDAMLRRFVRVTNLPSSLDQRGLEGLFRRFGPLRTSVVTTRLAPPGTAGFGYVAFQEREHAEEAVDELNGHLVDGRKLRVDWAYPRA